jgi:hypothetical protein
MYVNAQLSVLAEPGSAITSHHLMPPKGSFFWTADQNVRRMFLSIATMKHSLLPRGPHSTA